MVCITIPYCKHGDDIMLLCYGKHGRHSKRRGLGGEGGGSPRQLARNKDKDEERRWKLLKDDQDYENPRNQ